MSFAEDVRQIARMADYASDMEIMRQQQELGYGKCKTCGKTIPWHRTKCVLCTRGETLPFDNDSPTNRTYPPGA
jgi:RNA polymerase-binding transcription factor DksA